MIRVVVRLVFLALLLSPRVSTLNAAEIAQETLHIRGVAVRILDTNVEAQIDVPCSVRTESNSVDPSFTVVGELTGPGIVEPLRLETAPGRPFAIPGLPAAGTFLLQNIRVARGSQVVGPAQPSIATIQVANRMSTKVKVRQLTAAEIAERGIVVDSSSYDVFEYTFTFFVGNETQVVEVPMPVLVDRSTRAVLPIPQETPYVLPTVASTMPPRWSPPRTVALDLSGPEILPSGGGPIEQDTAPPVKRYSLPAALVLPSKFAVLHEFFSALIIVTNDSDASSTTVLRDVSATIRPSTELRVVGSKPSTSFGQPVVIHDKETGADILVAIHSGEAEWSLEGLRNGTGTFDVEVRATLENGTQDPIPLKGTAKGAIVIQDPHLTVTLSHPETVVAGDSYSSFLFVTNAGGATRNVSISSPLRPCPTYTQHVCLESQSISSFDLASGETKPVEFRLKSDSNGHVMAGAANVSDSAVSGAFQFTAAVGPSSDAVSPATLILPYYAQFAKSVSDAYLQTLGLGYSIAHAPVTSATASKPRVIESDVFARAIDISRAGQRIFICERADDEAANRTTRAGAYANLALDLLGNGKQLSEWDQLRRDETDGSEDQSLSAGAHASYAVARQLERSFLPTAGDLPRFADRFASATSGRTSFVLAVARTAHDAEATLEIHQIVGGLSVATKGVNESTPRYRGVPFSDLSRLTSDDGAATCDLALVGATSGDLDLRVSSSTSDDIHVDVLFPGDIQGHIYKGLVVISPAVAGQLYTIHIQPGSPILSGPFGSITADAVDVEPLKVLGIRQDLHLDPEGHKVAILFNRRIRPPSDLKTFRDHFSGRIVFNDSKFSYSGPRQVTAAAMQDDRRTVIATFDHALSQNVSGRTGSSYSLTINSIEDDLTGASSGFQPTDLPQLRIDNAHLGGIVGGWLMSAQHAPVSGADVVLTAGAQQYDSTDTEGKFLFEFVPRDLEQGFSGIYNIEAITAEGRHLSRPGAVARANEINPIVLEFIGTGSAEGVIRYTTGEPVSSAFVTASSRLANRFRTTQANGNGRFSLSDLPVGPLTFSATDAAGNVSYAAAEIRFPGELLQQDFAIYRRPYPGAGTIRGIVKTSDGSPVARAHVAVSTQEYALSDAFTDADGRFEFKGVPAGFVTVQAEAWNVAVTSFATDFDLSPDQVVDVIAILELPSATPTMTVSGTVTRVPPPPGASAEVANALVQIESLPIVKADQQGQYSISGVPVSFANAKSISAWDPLTKQSTSRTLPDVMSWVPIEIRSADNYSRGTIRLRLVDASGQPVPDYKVVDLANPSVEFQKADTGVYVLANVPAGRTVNFIAIPGSPASHGQQWVNGTARVDFDGQVAAASLRLPGEGTVRVRVLQSGIAVPGAVQISYRAWSPAEQGIVWMEGDAVPTDPSSGHYATLAHVPVGRFRVESAIAAQGYSLAEDAVGYQGEVKDVTLVLDSTSAVSGRVYSFDGVTPVAGAIVRLGDGLADRGSVVTAEDGSFEFRGLAGSSPFVIEAETTQNSILRVGSAYGRTPEHGGPVDHADIVLKKQAKIAANVRYSDGSVVSRAKISLRELAYPFRSFGTETDPLLTDAGGAYEIGNVFQGPVRISAYDNDGNRGDTVVEISEENVRVLATVTVAANGFGSIAATILDPDNHDAPVMNAEVALRRGGQVFDIGSTNSLGVVTFERVPAGAYVVEAYSAALSRSGSSATTVTNGSTSSLEVRLAFSGTVDGALVDLDQNGAGVQGANVTLSSRTFETRTTTTAGGLFQFPGVREGEFHLSARDPYSNRYGFLAGSLSQSSGVTPSPIRLELERTAALHVSVYLPDDHGDNSGVLAPAVTAEAEQRCIWESGVRVACDYLRTLQGNQLSFLGVLRQSPLNLTVSEVGGEHRTIRLTGVAFLPTEPAKNLNLVLPAYGSVVVKVTQRDSTGAPVSNARVSVIAGGRVVLAYSDASGVARFTGIPVGEPVTVQVQVSPVNGTISGGATALLVSRSTPLEVVVPIGALSGVRGNVTDGKSPTPGIRAVASFPSGRFEAITDGAGQFAIGGIPSSTAVHLEFFLSDGSTAAIKDVVTQSDSALADAGTVVLDSTTPELESVYPTDGSTEVSGSTSLKFVFSKKIADRYLTTAYFRLARSGVDENVGGAFSTAFDGTKFVITFTPAVLPLESHALYTVTVSSDVTDDLNHRIPSTRGFSFVTADFVGPRVAAVDPATTAPLPEAPSIRFGVRFTEPVVAEAFAAGGGATMRVLSSTGDVVSGEVTVDSTGAYAYVTTGTLSRSSTYRLEISGARDAHGNVQASTETFVYHTGDNVKPTVTFDPAEPATLVSGIRHRSVPIITDEGSSVQSQDIQRVEYYPSPGIPVSVSRAPFEYAFTPNVTTPTTFTLKAIAYDTSGNASTPAEKTWTLLPNGAPVLSSVRPSAASLFAGTHTRIDVEFTDEDDAVSVQIIARGTLLNGAPFEQQYTAKYRQSAGVWPVASFDVAIPADAKPGSSLSVAASATDAVGQVSAPVSPLILAIGDARRPTVSVGDVAPSQVYAGQTLRIVVSASAVDVPLRGITVTVAAAGKQISSVSRAFDAMTVGNEVFDILIPVGSFTADELRVDHPISIDVAVEDAQLRTPTHASPAIAPIMLGDTSGPIISLSEPAAGSEYDEGANVYAQVTANVTDGGVGVKNAIVEFDGSQYPMTRSGDVYSYRLKLPLIDGTTKVTKTITVRTSDLADNPQSVARDIVIRPVYSADDPVIKFVYPSEGAMYPAGAPMRLRVNAVGNSRSDLSDPVRQLDFAINGEVIATMPIATPSNTNDYDQLITVPAAATGSVTVTVTAHNKTYVSSVSRVFQVVSGVTIPPGVDTLVSSVDTTYENKTVVVPNTARLILSGSHSFENLVVLSGGLVKHEPTTVSPKRIDLSLAGGAFIETGGAIDVTGLGWSKTVSDVGASSDTGSVAGAGGSHGGKGADNGGFPAGVEFDSIVSPAEPGGAGACDPGIGNCDGLGQGGGIVRIQAIGRGIVIDGVVNANGIAGQRGGGGAGGAVFLKAAGAIGGVGQIHADGGSGNGKPAGGGGRVSLVARSTAIPVAAMTAKSSDNGAAGTMYIATTDSSGIVTQDRLFVDNAGHPSRQTRLPASSQGVVDRVDGDVVTLAPTTALSRWCTGQQIEFTLGAEKTAARITERISNTQVRVTAAPQDVTGGWSFRTFWKFDEVTSTNQAITFADSLQTGVIKSGQGSSTEFHRLDGSSISVSGPAKLLPAGTEAGAINVAILQVDSSGILAVDGVIEAASTVTVAAGGSIQQIPTSSTRMPRLVIHAPLLTVDGAISADAAGFSGSSAGAARTWPNTYTDGSYGGAGGSHGGRGAKSNWPAAAPFGSLYDPLEPGGAGATLNDYFNNNGNCDPCGTGGGVVDITAGEVRIAGSISATGKAEYADGWNHRFQAAGAGGSIRITAGTVSGSGQVKASGGRNGGGGGRVAIYATNANLGSSSDPYANVHVDGGWDGTAAGTLYVQLRDSSGAKISDRLIVDNDGHASSLPTELSRIGTGTITAVDPPQNGTVLVTLSADTQWFVEGAWLEIGTPPAATAYRIVERVSARQLRLSLVDGQVAGISIGDAYRGYWSFEEVIARENGILNADEIRTGRFTTSAGGSVEVSRAAGDLLVSGLLRLAGGARVRSVTVANGGTLEVNGSLFASSVMIQGGGILTHPASAYSATSYPILDVTAGEVVIDGAIDASGRGFSGSDGGHGKTWSDDGTTSGFNGAGGSHGGRGGKGRNDAASGGTFDSVFEPIAPGGAACQSMNIYNTFDHLEQFSPGGGVVRIRASHLTVNGSILANGISGGAGGSIWVTAESIDGGGQIRADSNNWNGGVQGGGGRVAVYSSAGLPAEFRSRISAFGSGASTSGSNGNAGTVYLKDPTTPNGDLIVDNGSRRGTYTTDLPAVTTGAVASATESSISVVQDTFPGPNFLAGVQLTLGGQSSPSWRITSNDRRAIRVDTSSAVFTGSAGQTFGGLYRFDKITLRNSDLRIIDSAVWSTLDKDASSTFQSGQTGANHLLKPSDFTALAPSASSRSSVDSDEDQCAATFIPAVRTASFRS